MPWVRSVSLQVRTDIESNAIPLWYLTEIKEFLTQPEDKKTFG